jgi:hypothetical protein
LEKLKLAAVKLLEVPEGTAEQALSQIAYKWFPAAGRDRRRAADLSAASAEDGIAARIRSLTEAEPIYPPIDFST